MKWILRNQDKAEPSKTRIEDSGVESSRNESDPDRNRIKPLSWLVWPLDAILIFALLHYSSYLALLWLPAYEGLDMKSNLTVDYKPWPVFLFQPVDPAIIDEIRQERGLPEQIVANGSNWPTAVSTAAPSTAVTAFASQTTSDQPPSSPGAVPTLLSSTPVPASTLLPAQSNATSQPTEAANPSELPKPPKKTKTPKPPKPPKND